MGPLTFGGRAPQCHVTTFSHDRNGGGESRSISYSPLVSISTERSNIWTIAAMHIILDANIYAADYRMNGVAFQSLFEYMRRTESQLVLPRATREEVVIGYGRQLKREAKVFEQAWKQYRRLDLSDGPRFTKPDTRRAMIDLRRKLMKPAEGGMPIYVPEITGNFVQEAFMRRGHRTS